MQLAALLVVSATSVALGNVIDTKHPFEFIPPSNSEGSLFGYSLALTNKTLYVGAPTHDVQGAVFKCDIKEQLQLSSFPWPAPWQSPGISAPVLSQ